MKNKIIIIVLSILFIASTSLGVLGFILKSKIPLSNPTPNVDTSKDGITYTYYLEDEEINEIPTNTIIYNEDGTTELDTKYLFKKHTCSEGLTGSFNTNTWKFDITNNTQKGHCKLYFVNSKYKVTFTLKNAIESEENNPIVEREKDGIFKLIPNEGYTYKEATCTNNKIPQWDDKNNTLTINAIMSDVNCDISFNRKQLKINIVVKNGKGNTTENIYYGDSKSIIVEPNEGYKNAKVSCTNNQTATFDNNTINFTSLTNDTSCTITFQKLAVVNYKLNVSNPTEFENISLISDVNQSIEIGKDGKIILRSTDGSTPKLSCGDSIPTTTELESTDQNKTIEYVFYNMSKDITCQIIK